MNEEKLEFDIDFDAEVKERAFQLEKQGVLLCKDCHYAKQSPVKGMYHCSYWGMHTDYYGFCYKATKRSSIDNDELINFVSSLID